MYRHHQNATLLQSDVQTETIGVEDTYQVPDLQESVSRDKDGVITVTLTNLSYTENKEIDMLFAELCPEKIHGTILQGDVHAYNTFENPEEFQEREFTSFEKQNNHVKFVIPAHSVLQFRIK